MVPDYNSIKYEAIFVTYISIIIMHTYISILRGINVSGQKMIKMEALRNAYKEIGLINIKTYIQSGNVIFQSNINDIYNLEKQISKSIADNFGLDVSVIIIEFSNFVKWQNNGIHIFLV